MVEDDHGSGGCLTQRRRARSIARFRNDAEFTVSPIFTDNVDSGCRSIGETGKRRLYAILYRSTVFSQKRISDTSKAAYAIKMISIFTV